MVLTNEPPVREVTPTPPPRRRTSRLGDRGLAALFISPAMLLLLAMSVFPLLWALTLSFTNYSATSSAPAEFVGFANYAEILTSPAVRQRALTTLVYVVGAVTLQTVLGFGIAYLISRRERGRGLLTTVFLVPMMLSPVVVGLFWRFMLDAQFGVVNSLLTSVGLQPVEWLTRQETAMISLIVVDTWQWTPFIMLIALAGLTAVPRYLYEAASIDRASEWFRFRNITLPLVWPLLLIAVMFRAIEAFRLFDLVYILTNGGPGVSTETLSFHVYKVAFLGFNTGTASAYGILMVVVVIVLAQVYLRYLNKLKED
ncbi:sugar ABC transporter permease [Cellulosimicrobium cellulans]|uniref:Sugar ABC transporter permease n=1 Tax=Cellulosimicrobium composti TaxID=2672572 RepID=A0ABX0BBE0_9MICO|nr:sugar ABC transporter permease [Cellulosimicrobium composti]TWG87806.1 multiple sugar transport system permease protein [Cellulosimicrobium cellulans J34]SME95616.1 carbohydrate ABC transporter membrane protein 1, CUT1 family (TC 3.A.1.1.-) [Cellulosimicrobium cellulans J1]